MRSILMRFLRNREGAITIEHILLFALVGSVVLTGLVQFSTTLRSAFDAARSDVAFARSGPSATHAAEEVVSTTSGKNTGFLFEADEKD